MTALLVWRFVKYVALLLVAGGTAGAFAAERPDVRQWMVYGVATSGLALTWVAGFGLIRTAGWSMRAPFIGGSIVLSLAWLAVLVWTVERPERRTSLWLGVTVAPLLGALALMVFRPT